MAVELFGFTIGRTQKEKEQQDRVSFTLPQSEDGAIDVAGTPGGAYATYLDMEGSAKNEADLILRYRSMALFPEAEIAIDDIVNDAVVADREQAPVSLNLSNVNISPDIKTKISENFQDILGLLKFNDTAFDTFRKWYVDGRLYYHIIIDPQNPKKGILELRPIDALKIKKYTKIIILLCHVTLSSDRGLICKSRGMGYKVSYSNFPFSFLKGGLKTTIWCNVHVFERWIKISFLTDRINKLCNTLMNNSGLTQNLSVRIICLKNHNDWDAAALTLSTASNLEMFDQNREKLLIHYLDPNLMPIDKLSSII